jgi:hypothetical protein
VRAIANVVCDAKHGHPDLPPSGRDQGQTLPLDRADDIGQAAHVSFDVMILDPDTAPTAEQIYESPESEEPEAPLSRRMTAAIDECSSRWPAYDHADNEVDAPWASWPLAREVELPIIELNIRWDYADVMLPALIEIASRHEIVLYDPQRDEVHLPPRLR